MVSKNSALEYSRSVAGIGFRSRRLMEGTLFSSKVTKHERKLVPPASITITVVFLGGCCGGISHVGIISRAGPVPTGTLGFCLRPSSISYSSVSIIVLSAGPSASKLCRPKNAATVCRMSIVMPPDKFIFIVYLL